MDIESGQLNRGGTVESQRERRRRLHHRKARRTESKRRPGEIGRQRRLGKRTQISPAGTSVRIVGKRKSSGTSGTSGSRLHPEILACAAIAGRKEGSKTSVESRCGKNETGIRGN